MGANRITRFILTVSVFAMTIVFSAPSQAIPAFARQTGKACLACHFQHFPALNAMGQAFKASGYSEMGKQSTVKGDDISLPSVLNASLFSKIRYQKSNGTDAAGTQTTASGQLQFPDELALLFGGRVAENIGFMLEGQLANGTAPVMAGFKIPFMYNIGKSTKVGIVPYTTDALGASYGFELLSTGAVRNIRTMEHRNESSAQQYIGTATAAMGVALVVWDPSFFVNVSAWSPNNAAVAEGMANGNPKSIYTRVALTPTFGAWETGFGVQYWGGSSNIGAANDVVTAKQTKAWALDAQAQGAVMGMPLGVYLTYADAKGAANSLFNTNPNSKHAASIAGELGVVPNKATIMLSYRDGDNGAASDNKDNALTFGGTYAIAQNVQLQLQHSNSSRASYDGGGDKLTTLMLATGL